jgi:hypothetical protein
VPDDRLYLGWQYATPCPEPGPPPRRPTPPEQERLNPDWVTAQRREESLLNRPLKAALAVAAALGVAAAALAAAGLLDVLVAGVGVICCALVAAFSGYAIWQGERALRTRIADERTRVGRVRAVQEDQLFAGQAEHATRVREWQALRVAYEHQKRWYAVRAPAGVHRVEIAGGTLSGWSAMLGTAGAHRLATGGEVTVLDLSDGSVALDLLGFARTAGIDPLVLVLPEDLPSPDLAAGLSRGALADVLSLVGTALAPRPRSALRVIALSRRADAAEGRVLGTYLAVALTRALREAQPGRPWQHTLFVLGADRLHGDTLDRLTDVCESTETGLVLTYRAISPNVRPRLGRGNAVVAFMRPGRAEDAEVAIEQLGAGHRFVLSQLTETVGRTVTDTTASAYTPAAGSVASAAGSVASAPGSVASAAAPRPAGQAVSTGISTSTAWGMTTAKATGDSESLALAQRRSREFLLERDELGSLPASVMIITYASPAGRQVVMADANPGIGGLSAATKLTLEEFAETAPTPAGAAPRPEPKPASADRDDGKAAPVSWRSDEDRPAPNLGPPPPRLDWRKGRS